MNTTFPTGGFWMRAFWMQTFWMRAFWITASFVAPSLVGQSVADEINFNRDISPILSDKCNFCHGPDENTRQAGLRLDIRDDALGVLESGELVDRIISDDADVRMPPPESKLSLTANEKRLLKKWVASGAPYAKHWAFELLRAEIPIPHHGDSKGDHLKAQPDASHTNVTDQAWCKQTLDRFVLWRIEQAGLQPAGEASPLRWLRRVTFDLTGLPPTPESIADFQSAIEGDREAAMQAVVDRLLDSEAFGEHMAVAWLDLARYADSYGYQSDKLNTQWPYRDWVVGALNDNLPYDQFLTWQLAGDLLDNPTVDQRLATAFNRIHRLNNEGGAVFEEWRIENVADRVHTFGTAVLGLTMECCRCHDHKYDPISMRDYYSLSAFFNSIDESGVYDRTEKVPCPSMLLPTDDQTIALEQARKRLANANQAYQNARADALQRCSQTKRQSDDDAPKPADQISGSEHVESEKFGKLNIPDLKVALSFDRPFDNQIKAVYHPSESDRRWTAMPDGVEVSNTTIPRIDLSTVNDLVDSEPEPKRRALSLDGERGVTVKGIEPLDRWTPFTVVITLRETKRSDQRSLIAHHTRGTDCGYNGWDLTIVNGHVESRMYRVWPGNAIGVRTTDAIEADVWHQLSATYDGSSQAAGLKLFLNGKPLATTVLRDEVKKSANVKVDHGGEFVIGQRFRARGLDGGLIDDVRLYTRNLTPIELQQLAQGTSSPPSAEYFASAIDETCRKSFDELNAARKAWVMAEEAMTEIPVMRELDAPRPTHLLARGQYDAETSDETRVNRDVLAGLPLPFPADQPRNRLGLARWVTDPSHPLTARVAVNHLWGNFFSDPLVRTPENFGMQGELPTHPELLDWLARDFINNGWDVKRFCRNVVLSATYRQDSRADANVMQADPENRLLCRGPSHRFNAEEIRDLALSASGLINHEIGGPPVSPYQPSKDLWRESNGMSPPYQQSVGQALYRRSLYSVWKRTAPLPNMMAFDSTTREVCTVKRSRTNTPMQALVLLNDVQFVEAARALAEQVMSLPSHESRIHDAFLRLTGRPPDAAEMKVLSQLIQQERKHFTANTELAIKFLDVGTRPRKDDTDAVELAAMTTVCQAILNLDATIWKR